METTDQDRVMLAEAMGWEFHEGTIDNRYWCLSSPDAGYPDKYHSKWKKPPGQDWQCELCGCGDDVPDPFTDANDDYAVLEWMREDATFAQYDAFRRMLPFQSDYKRGDYARAALKVIKSLEGT